MSKRRARLHPEAEATQFILSGGDKPCLKVQWINDYKGRGVFACAPIEKGSFVVEYRGELISQYERDKRQKKYREKQNVFLFDFEWNSSSWCIDASHEDDSLGRLVNDGHKSSNCKMKKLTVHGKPHLCLFAIEDIQAESEITYDYGESQWPWRALTPSVQTLTQPSADQEVCERSTSSFQQTPSVQILTQPSADQEVCERSTSSFQQKPSVQILTQPSADQEVCESSTSSFQQTPSVQTLTQPSADQEVCERSTSSFQQRPSVQILTQPFADQEASERSTSSFQQRPSVQILTQPFADQEASERSTSSFQQKPNVQTLTQPFAGQEASERSTSSFQQTPSVQILTQPSADQEVCESSTSSFQQTPSVQILTQPSADQEVCESSTSSFQQVSQTTGGVSFHQTATAKQISTDESSDCTDYDPNPIPLGMSCSANSSGNTSHNNFNPNATMATSGAGEMVACQRPTRARESDGYRHCEFCQGLYARDCLWRHVRNCPEKSIEGEPPTGRKRIQLDLPKPDQIHEAVWKIACEMNQDDISLVVRSERDILSLGESLYNARKPHERRKDYICQKMREMARLLITARAMTPLKSTEDLVMPSNFPQVIQAVRAVAGYELESNSYKTPSLALKLGHSLAKVAGIVQCNAIIANRYDVAELAKQFATLYEKKWTESISAAALGTLKQAKWNKPQVLPFTQDVLLLHQFLATESAKCVKDLEENRNSITFGNLAKVTLTQVVLFNGKRQGEVSKMELRVFTSRNRTELNPDIMIGLTELERKLARHFDRVEIRGKGSRMVPVLLTSDMIAAMHLLVTNRNECQVCTQNVYLFARPGVLSHYRGSDCFRKYAKQCGAKYPEALTSTRFWKQVATLSTVLNLKENEMDQLATFLGHNIRVHRELYRLPESTLQLAKVSKLFMAMEKGKLSDLQGKGLDDIEINHDDEVTTSDDDSSEETVADLHQHKGSRTETPGNPSHAPDSTTLDSMEGTSASTTLDNMEGTSASTTLDNKNGNTEPRNAGKVRSELQSTR
ncbi:uncharacterized protein LOC115580511 isoform X2 [Sparus aurata]|uniref:uncharacterized protein LOC115580511 isoform X2 n=1 Tax=Sparus aurata TaxID=8175 RepID=UPI0011C0E62C|nr:uncharacterized protein LOC115580511 isoform X2 [Sparus aurata]